MAKFSRKGRQEAKMKKESSLKLEYNRLYAKRIKGGDKSVPTYAQWLEKRKPKSALGSYAKKAGGGQFEGQGAKGSDLEEIKKRFGKKSSK